MLTINVAIPNSFVAYELSSQNHPRLPPYRSLKRVKRSTLSPLSRPTTNIEAFYPGFDDGSVPVLLLLVDQQVI